MEDSLAGSDKDLGDEGGATVTCRRERADVGCGVGRR